MEPTIEQHKKVSLRGHKLSMSDNMLDISNQDKGIENMLKEGTVVKFLEIGNTKIKFCDDYCRDRTPDEVQKILDRIAYMAQLQLSACSDK